MIDLQQSDYMRTLEGAIQFGFPVVLQNVHEKLDPSLDPILNKSLMKIGRCTLTLTQFLLIWINQECKAFSFSSHPDSFHI